MSMKLQLQVGKRYVDLDLGYSENLELVTRARWGANNSYDMSKYRSATARQRCEAYLRTIGKWSDEKGGDQ